MSGKRAYVTIAEGSFGKGAIALARTLARHSDGPLICADLGLEPADRAALGRLGVELRPIEPVEAAFADPTWAPSMAKLRLFGWTDLERIAYLDSDTIVTGPVDELLGLEAPFAACPDLGIRLSHERFNAGVLALAPDAGLEARLLARVTETDRDGFWASERSDPRWLERHPSDQGFLNLWFRDGWARLQPRFNVSKRLYRHHPELWSELVADLRVLHFIGRKPWWPASEEDRERGYEELDELWWRAFEGEEIGLAGRT